MRSSIEVPVCLISLRERPAGVLTLRVADRLISSHLPLLQQPHHRQHLRARLEVVVAAAPVRDHRVRRHVHLILVVARLALSRRLSHPFTLLPRGNRLILHK